MISDAVAPSSANRVAKVWRNACKLAPLGTRSCTPARRKHDTITYSKPPRPIASPRRSNNRGEDRPNRTPKRTRHDSTYAEIMSANDDSTGTDRSREPLPTTCNRNSPRRPTNDPTVKPRISADRNPATKPNATTNTSRSGHGSRPPPDTTADNNRSGVSSPRNGFGTGGVALGRATPPIGFPANHP